jgi:hypothetical protein
VSSTGIVHVRDACAAVLLLGLSACGASASTTQTPSETTTQGTSSPSVSPPQEAKAIDLDAADLGPGYSLVADAEDTGRIGWKRHFVGSAASIFEIVNSLTDVDPSAADASVGQGLIVNQLIDSSGGKTIALPPGLPPDGQALQFTNSGLVGIQVIWTEQNLLCIVTVVPRPNSDYFAQIGDLASIQDGRAQAAVSG